MFNVGGVGGNNFDKFNLINEFKQEQGTFNCVPIAFIKASMDKYGDQMFKNVSQNGNGFDVTLRNGDKVSVSKDEVEQARKELGGNGNGNSEVMDQASLAYAVIAKRKAEEKGTNFGDALRDLKKDQGGEKYEDVAKWLGIAIERINPNQVGNEDAAVVSTGNGGHALYVDDGKKVDSWGNQIGYDPSKYTDAYRLV